MKRARVIILCMSFLLPISASAWPEHTVDHIVKGGADKFYDALDEILGHEAYTSDPLVRGLVYLIAARGIPSELNDTLCRVIKAYDVVGDGLEVAEDLLRALIRAGAEDWERASECVEAVFYGPSRKKQASYLEKLYTELVWH